MEELVRTPFVREINAISVDPRPDRPPLPSWLKSVPTLVVLGEDKPRVGPGPVTNWLHERRIMGAAPARPAGGAGAGGGPTVGIPGITGIAAPSHSERNTLLVSPVYSPDIAPRPVASATATPTAAARLPAAVSATTAGDSSMAPPSLAGASDDGPTAYHFSEMGDGKWSNNYSMLSSDGWESNKGYDPFMKNFEPLISVVGGHGGAGGGGGGAAAPATKKSAKEEAMLREFEAFMSSRDKDIAGPIMRK